MTRKLLPAILLLGTVLPAGATVLQIDLTVDNIYNLYLSTDDTSPGTLIGSDSDWPSVESYAVTLSPGQDYFLHVEATDVGVISGFLGDFTLSDAAFAFDDGSQYLLTGTSLWQVSKTGFGSGYQTPVLWSYDLPNAKNGVAPWYFRSGIDADAEWIWSPDKCINCTAYFSTPIRYQGTEVPEPGTLSLAALAGMLLLCAGRRLSAGQVTT